MALTKIFTGMEKGPEMIDANFEKITAEMDNLVTDTGWVSDGITYLNGFKLNIGDPIEYRAVTINDIVFFMISGYIEGTGKDGVVARLPENALVYVDEIKYNAKSIVGRTSVKNVKGRFAVDQTGQIILTTYGGVLNTNDSLWIDQLSILIKK